MMDVAVATVAMLQSNHHHHQINNQIFTGLMQFLSPNQQRQNTEGKQITQLR